MKSSINSVTKRFAAVPLPIGAVLLSLCLLRTASAQNFIYDATILSNAPAAYYEMQESPGAGTAVDSTGNGFTGGIQYDIGYNGTNDYPVLGLPGVDTNAYLFHVYSDINAETHISDVSVSASSTLNPSTPFSVECWARPTSDASNYDPPVASASGSYPLPGWMIFQTPGTPGAWALDVQSSGVFIQSGSTTKNQWSHLVSVYDGVNFTFYVNGVAIGTQSGSHYVPNPSTLYIGADPLAPYGAFEGYVTQVAIYTNALTAAQVLNDYKVGTNSFSTNAEPPQVLVDAGEINTDPASIEVNAGAPATFDPIVVGSTPLAYQWYSNNVAIAGATSSILSFTATETANNSTFYVVVTNSFGSSTSEVATLTVFSQLVINSAPMSITRNVGSYAAFHVTASGTAPLGYQWSVSSNAGSTFSPISGGTNETLWLSNVQLAQNNNEYSVLVTGPGVSSNIAPATLTVQPRTENVTLSGYGAVVASDKPVAFWQLNETNGSSTAIDAVGSFDGAYTYTVTNSVPDTNSIIYGVTGGVPNDTNTAVDLTSPEPGVASPGFGGTIVVPWAPELNPDTPWSVETWVQPSSLGINGSDYRVVLSSEYHVYPFNNDGWYIYQQPAPANTFSFVPQPGNPFISAGTVVPGNWYQLVITDDGTNFDFYLNGVLAVAPFPVPSADFVPNGDGINSDGSAAIGQSGSGIGNFIMGQRDDVQFTTFQGGMEDTAIYNYALTPKQITTHYLNQVLLTITPSGTNVIVNWPLGVGTLQESSTLNGTYANMNGVTPPYTNAISGKTMFYRLLRQ